MKTMFSRLLSVAFLAGAILGIAGCTEVRYLTKKEFVVLELDPLLFRSIKPTEPPDRKLFIGEPGESVDAKLKRRVTLLQNHAIRLYGDLDTCNRRLYAIEKIHLDGILKIEELNSKEVAK